MSNQRVIRYCQSHKLKPMDFEHFMHLALQQASLAGEEVPVGAVLVSKDGQVLASGYNRREIKSDPTSHAEIEVIREAARVQGDWRLQGCTLFVTLEPCVMCAGAILAARISRVVFGAWEPHSGAGGSHYDLLRDRKNSYWVEVIPGVLEKECSDRLSGFFANLRNSEVTQG